jgi:hypothetical protein
MKLNNNYIILLLAIIILSSIAYFLVTDNVTKEGYSDLDSANKSSDDSTFTSLDDETVPGCDNDSRVPPCYSTIQTDYNDFTSDFLRDDNYILKSQIVTPVCPSNPYPPFGSDISANDDATGTGDINFSDFSSFLNSKYTKDSSYNKLGSYDSSLNIYNNITNTTYKTENISPGAEPKIDPTSVSNWMLSNPHTNNANVNNNASGDPKYNNETPEPATNTANNTSQPSTINESKSTCPPCPSCQRCPEPVVECKRVINYKNPNASSRIPVPIIDDFSNFTK